MSTLTQPLVSMSVLERALSPQRLAAYRLETDRDETDGLARYVWNIALGNAFQPVLQTLEIAFRNEIARAAGRLTAGRGYAYDRIPSWMDARPTMLLDHEAEKVESVKRRLGSDPRYHTEAHLIAKLDFGFWVSLCRDTYADYRAQGPRLWPRALAFAFRARPAHVQTRGEIHHRFDRIRQYRNRVAHHEPIWDRDYLEMHEYLLESLAWMSPKLSDALRATSPAPGVFAAGPEAYRPHAETLLGSGPGLAAMLESKLQVLSSERRDLLAPLLDALATMLDVSPRDIAAHWADAIPDSV